MLCQSETQHGCRPHRCWQLRRGLPQFHRRPRSIRVAPVFLAI